MPSLVLQIQQAARLFDRMLDPVVAELGVELSDLPILVTAERHRGVTVTSLRDWFGYPPASVSLALRRLEAQGYVRRAHDSPDARIVSVYATRPGRDAARVALARIGYLESQIGRSAGPHTVEACFKVLESARAVRLPRSMVEVSIPRRRRP